MSNAADQDSHPAPTRVSVVIAALNVVDVIDVQLTALAEQEYDGDLEVVVGDNGSTDGLRAHLEGHPLREQLGLRWVDASGARGVSHARNVGVAAATGDFIAFCDADDRVDPRGGCDRSQAARPEAARGGGRAAA
ncbi:glycosyltransferase family 2 protein, partial [Rhodococcus sp. NPDC058514]|uniref:glycosyltransferase family 2 protein n=1 Tax=Rhodococcus sp. NPDC058514 TaxID=3346532 RepID=UPI0036672500